MLDELDLKILRTLQQNGRTKRNELADQVQLSVPSVSERLKKLEDNKIIEGYLWIDSIDSVEVKGRWRFNLVSNCENMGPQIGKGNFEGTTDMWGHMLFNLNPGMIDNNVLLEGSMQLSYRIDGRWSYIGFPGVINWGSFKAEQLR